MLKENNLKELVKKAIANGGLTINKELKEVLKNDGYFVSMLGYEKTFTINQTNELIENIKLYQKNLLHNEFIGLWLENNVIYLDVSKHYEKKQTAILAGIKNKQRAIYDCKNKKDIELTKKVYILYEYNKTNNDYDYIKEYLSTKDIIKEFKLKHKRSVYQYVADSLDQITNLLQDRYILISEIEYISNL